MPYHVRITTRTNRSRGDELALDLDEATLMARFVRPYLEAEAITTRGRTILPQDIERIRVNFTDQTSQQLIPHIQAERRASRVVVAGISDEWYVTNRGDDVTDDFITGPPGSAPGHAATSGAESAGERPQAVAPSKQVFVVHGRNLRARDALFAFLRAIGLEPLEWEQMVAEADSGVPYIGDVLDRGMAMASGVVVLLTPDDEARLRDPFHSAAGEPPHESDLTGQARANVLFEAGMALGRYPARCSSSSVRCVLSQILLAAIPYGSITARSAAKGWLTDYAL